MDFTIERAEAGDFGRIADMINENIDLTRKYDEDLCKRCGVDFFVIRSGKKIVGCGGVKRITKNTSEIAHVVIDKDFRGRGLGKRLINFLTEKVFEDDFGKAYVTVNVKNGVMVKVLEKMGFEREGKLKHHFGKNRHIYAYAKYNE